MQYTLFVFLAPVAAVVMAVTLAYALHRRATPGAKPLAAYLAASAGYLIGNTLELVDPTQAGTLFWAKFNYLFIAALPVAWFAFVLEYTGRRRWLAPGRFWVIVVVPLLTFLFAQTNALHQLVWESYTFVTAGPYLKIDVVHGPWFWLSGLYTYALVISGAIVMIHDQYFVPAPRAYRIRTALLVTGGLFPLVFNLIYVYHMIPGWTKDYSPLAYALSGVFFALVLFRYGLLDLMPVARSLLVEEMPDGMLIIDRRRRVVDYNPAALGILGMAGDPVGKQLEAVWPECGTYLAFPDGADADSLTRPDVMHLQRGSHRLSFALRVMPVGEDRRIGRRTARRAAHHDPQGWMILLTDVTRRVEAERGMSEANTALRRLNENLEARIASRTLALSERAAELEALSRVSVALRRAVGMEELLHILLVEAIANVKAAAGAIFVVEGEALVLRAVQGLEISPDAVGQAHPLGTEDGGPSPFSSERWRNTGALRAAAPEANPALHGQNSLREVLETGQMVRWGCLPEAMRAYLGGSAPGGPVIVTPVRAGAAGGTARVLGLLVVCYEAAGQPVKTGGESETESGMDAERLLTAIAEVGSNAFQRVRAMENLEQLVESRTRHLSTLYDIMAVTNEFLELPGLLDATLQTIRSVLGPRAVTMHLVEENGSARLRLAGCVGILDPQFGAEEADTAETPWRMAQERGGMVVLPRLETPLQGEAGELRAAIAVPVRAKGRQLGVLTVLDESIGQFSAEDIALLGAIADQAGVAVESAQLRERARQKAEEAAVMEERQRLARDLHDSVTQSLYSVVLFSEAVKDSLRNLTPPAPQFDAVPPLRAEPPESGELPPLRRDLTPQASQFAAVPPLRAEPTESGELPPLRREGEEEGEEEEEKGDEASIGRAMENLEQLREAGQQALKEMRLLIYELRPQALARDGLVGALRNRLEMVERRSGVTARLEVDGLFPLPEAVETGLYGIAQEALNNVLKHAQATQVLVRLAGAGRTITLEVRDNGTGLPREILEGTGESLGVGLTSMRERAHQMGGALAVESSADGGTRVVATVDGIEDIDAEEASG